MNSTAKYNKQAFITYTPLEILAISAILLIAAYLRLHNLTDNPGWYTDETTHINIAQNLLKGHNQYLAINQSYLLFGRLPLFEHLLAMVMRVFSPDITTLRTLTGILGTLSVGLLYVGLRVIQSDRLLPLLAALMLTLYPSAVLYSRFGFSYALLTPLVIIICCGLTFYLDTGKRYALFIAGLCLGFGLTSDLMIGSLLPVLIIIVLLRRPQDLIWILPLTAGPFTLYSLTMLLTGPTAFLFDLNYTLGRLSTVAPNVQLEYLLDNYRSLLAQESLLLPSIIGLFLLKPTNIRLVLILAFGIPIPILGRTVALYSLSFYYMIPLLPIIAVGLGSVIRYSFDFLKTQLIANEPNRLGVSIYLSNALILAVLFLLIGVPLTDASMITFNGVRDGFITPIEPFLIDGADARQIANYINPRTDTQTLVIAPPPITWLLNANVSDLQMSIAATGQTTPHLPANIPPERYAFQIDYQQAAYVIVDPIWRNWGVIHLPGAATILSDIETNWQLVLDTGTNQVYTNPDTP